MFGKITTAFHQFLLMCKTIAAIALMFVGALFLHVFTNTKKKRADEAAKLPSHTKEAIKKIREKCRSDEIRVESKTFRPKSSNILLHFVLSGPDDGDLIVMLHGFPECWYTWHGIIPHLVDAGYLVAALDMRGFGQSDHPEGINEYSESKLVEDVSDLIHHLKYESAVVVGHDWGAAVAWNFARMKPKMLEKLVIINVPHPDTMKSVFLRNPEQFFKSWYIFAFQIPYVFEWICAAIPFLASNKHYNEDGQKMNRASQARGINGMLNYYRAILLSLWRKLRLVKTPLGQKHLRRVKVIEQPILMIWGTDDVALCEDFADTLTTGKHKQLVPDFKLVKFHGCSHWVPIEKPTEVAKGIKDFLEN